MPDAAPSKPSQGSTRKQCWASRDLFFQCLRDKNEDVKKCETEGKAYEKKCPKSWVMHFNLQREYQKPPAMMDDDDDD